MIWAALLHFPDENLTESRHGECCCVLTNGLTNGRCQEGAGGWRGSHFSPWEHFRKKKEKAKGCKKILKPMASESFIQFNQKDIFIFCQELFYILFDRYCQLSINLTVKQAVMQIHYRNKRKYILFISHRSHSSVRLWDLSYVAFDLGLSKTQRIQLLSQKLILHSNLQKVIHLFERWTEGELPPTGSLRARNKIQVSHVLGKSPFT